MPNERDSCHFFVFPFKRVCIGGYGGSAARLASCLETCHLHQIQASLLPPSPSLCLPPRARMEHTFRQGGRMSRFCLIRYSSISSMLRLMHAVRHARRAASPAWHSVLAGCTLSWAQQTAEWETCTAEKQHSTADMGFDPPRSGLGSVHRRHSVDVA